MDEFYVLINLHILLSQTEKKYYHFLLCLTRDVAHFVKCMINWWPDICIIIKLKRTEYTFHIILGYSTVKLRN